MVNYIELDKCIENISIIWKQMIDDINCLRRDVKYIYDALDLIEDEK
jgi:hypothetical protein